MMLDKVGGAFIVPAMSKVCQTRAKVLGSVVGLVCKRRAAELYYGHGVIRYCPVGLSTFRSFSNIFADGVFSHGFRLAEFNGARKKNRFRALLGVANII